MYEDFYQLKADPFRLSPDHRFCFTHSSYKKARAYMEYALHRAEGFVMITGKPGSGKTTLINDLLDELSQSKVTVAMLMISQLEAHDLLRMVAFSFGLTGDLSNKATIIHELTVFINRQYKGGRRALLIVDEAQDLSISAMEELRLLTNLQIDNQPLLQIFLVGQDELRNLMQSPKMVQGHQRIVAACHLEPLKEEETGAYIRHRLSTAGWNGNPEISTTIFPIIHIYSAGIPRTINLICSRLFLHAFVEKHQKIGISDIRTVLIALQQEQLIPSNSSTCPKLEADAFFDLKDEYTREEEQSPELGPAAKEVLAPISDLKVPRTLDNPVNMLPVSLEPIESVANTTAPIQPTIPEDMTQAELTDATDATPDRSEPEPEETVTQDNEGGDPEQDTDAQFISLENAPVAPDKTEPMPSETPDPIPVPGGDSGPTTSEKDVAPPDETSPDSSEISHVSMATPADLAPTKRRRGYWFSTLLLVGFLAAGGAVYTNNQASFDAGSLVQQAQQLKASILSKLGSQKPVMASNKDSLAQQKSSLGTEQKQTGPSSMQAAVSEPLESVPGIETPTVGDSATNDQYQLASVEAEKEPPPIQQDTTYFAVDEATGPATLKSRIDVQTPESDSIASSAIRSGIATTEKKVTSHEVQTRQVLFGYKSMEIQPQFMELLNEAADELRESQDTVAWIVGIVENRGNGTSDYNRIVSNQRAQEVTRYLISRGIAAERLITEDDSRSLEQNHENIRKQAVPKPQRLVEVTVLLPVD